MKPQECTLPEYIHHLGNLYTGEDLDSGKSLPQPDFFNFFFPSSSAIFFILDYRTGKFHYITKNFPKEFRNSYDALKEGGIEYFTFLQHPEDRKIFNREIFMNRIKFMKSIPEGDHPSYCYSNNFRMIDSNKKCHHFLRQHVNAKTDAHGMPLIASGVCFNITNYKSDTKMVDTIYRFNETNGLDEVYSHNYFPSDDGGLSRREIEILKYVLEGFTSEKIANKLFLSHHTVKTHRKNMLQKTNSKNIGELLRYAIENRLI